MGNLQQALAEAGLTGRQTGHENAEGLVMVPSYGSRLGWLVEPNKGRQLIPDVVGSYCLIDSTGFDYGTERFSFWEQSASVLGNCDPIWERFIHADNRWVERKRYCSFSLSATQSYAVANYRRPRLDTIYLIATLVEAQEQSASDWAKGDVRSITGEKGVDMEKYKECFATQYKKDCIEREAERLLKKQRASVYRSKLLGKQSEDLEGVMRTLKNKNKGKTIKGRCIKV